MSLSTRPLARIAAALVLAAAAVVAIAWPAAPSAADVADFSYDRWHVEYRIDVDEEGRAEARVRETLTARFPEFDQNRGLVRGLPEDYEGVSTRPRDFRVTDAVGDAVPFEIEREDGFVAVLTGDDRFVHGVQTYVIEYTLSDVILARDDGRADEFYWDLTDYEHAQPIDAFSAEIAFSPALADRLTGDAACYWGAAESTERCDVRSDGGVFRLAQSPLAPFQGVTVAIGLEPASVVQPPQRLPNFALDGLPLIIGGAGLVTSIAGVVAVGRLAARRRVARGTVVAQYEVPPELPPLVAGPIVGSAKHVVPAEIVHLAVRGAIRIEDGEPERGLFGPKDAPPVLRVVDPALAADPMDTMALSTLFPSLEPGAAFAMPKEDEAFAKRVGELDAAGAAAAAERGYFTKERSRAGRALGLASIAVAAVLAVFAVLGFVLRPGAVAVISAAAAAVVLVLGLIAMSRHRVHTPLGAEWREHLEGVRLFIRVAEADRLAVLQSASGAERRSDGAVDVVHLYERLLPYAMLFGLEREWGRVLEVQYREHPGYAPLWYPGVAAHGVADLGSTISSFTSSLQSSVSYSSSSSGGSGGGGFSGGGGGGGFSGGR